jgi:DNA recombination protein RmuC
MSLSTAAAAALVLAAALALLAGWLLGRRRVHALELELAAARAQLEAADVLVAERDRLIDAAAERLRAGFDTAAAEALRGNSEVFLQLARQVLGQQRELASRDLADREQSVAAMLAPLRSALQQTHEQIARIERERAESVGALRASLEGVALAQQSLQRETRNLVTALRRPEVRGQWGEMTLRRIVELAGMVEHCDFTEQLHVSGEDGAQRPDMVVNMPGGRRLVVDVKTPLDAYLSAVEAVDDEARAAALRRHAQAVSDRVRSLASKAYWAQFEHSPDFVVLFIPGDQFLAAALDELPTLLEDAIRQHVILTTPSSLVALLKAVAYGWRQDALAENAARIQALGEDLYRRLARFTGHLARLGRSLGTGVEAYNAAVGSLERQVLPGARRFAELGLDAGEPIEELALVDRLPRSPRTEDGVPADE